MAPSAPPSPIWSSFGAAPPSSDGWHPCPCSSCPTGSCWARAAAAGLPSGGIQAPAAADADAACCPLPLLPPRAGGSGSTRLRSKSGLRSSKGGSCSTTSQGLPSLSCLRRWSQVAVTWCGAAPKQLTRHRGGPRAGNQRPRLAWVWLRRAAMAPPGGARVLTACGGR